MRKRVTVCTSDLSGEDIPDGTGASVTLRFYGRQGSGERFDLTSAEADRIFSDARARKLEQEPPRRRSRKTSLDEVLQNAADRSGESARAGA
jgi:hypothetical protein